MKYDPNFFTLQLFSKITGIAGRARKYAMHPLTCTELGNDFFLEKALQFGMLPEVYTADDPKHYLNTYVSTYLIDGHALETLVLQHIRAFNDYYQLGYKLYYWRTKNGIEVDFIMYGEHGLIAIEVKRKRNISSKDLRGLKIFSQDYSVAKLYCFYGGDTREHHCITYHRGAV